MRTVFILLLALVVTAYALVSDAFSLENIYPTFIGMEPDTLFKLTLPGSLSYVNILYNGDYFVVVVSKNDATILRVYDDAGVPVNSLELPITVKSVAHYGNQIVVTNGRYLAVLEIPGLNKLAELRGVFTEVGVLNGTIYAIDASENALLKFTGTEWRKESIPDYVEHVRIFGESRVYYGKYNIMIARPGGSLETSIPFRILEALAPNVFLALIEEKNTAVLAVYNETLSKWEFQPLNLYFELHRSYSFTGTDHAKLLWNENGIYYMIDVNRLVILASDTGIVNVYYSEDQIYYVTVKGEYDITHITLKSIPAPMIILLQASKSTPLLVGNTTITREAVIATAENISIKIPTVTLARYLTDYLGVKVNVVLSNTILTTLDSVPAVSLDYKPYKVVPYENVLDIKELLNEYMLVDIETEAPVTLTIIAVYSGGDTRAITLDIPQPIVPAEKIILPRKPGLTYKYKIGALGEILDLEPGKGIHVKESAPTGAYLPYQNQNTASTTAIPPEHTDIEKGKNSNALIISLLIAVAVIVFLALRFRISR